MVNIGHIRQAARIILPKDSREEEKVPGGGDHSALGRTKNSLDDHNKSHPTSSEEEKVPLGGAVNNLSQVKSGSKLSPSQQQEDSQSP